MTDTFPCRGSDTLVGRCCAALDVDTESELKDAIWLAAPDVQQTLSGSATTDVAKRLDWTDYAFPEPPDKPAGSVERRGVVLEAVNNQPLAVLAADGTVYQLGDTVRFETTRTARGWGRRRSGETVTRENNIDYLSDARLSISRYPTYSNVPRDSPSATLGRDDIELVARSDLSAYRQRLAEGTGIDIPASVNGWELVDVETADADPDETILPTDLVTEIQWSDTDHTTITARWRHAYNCWRLSVPVEGVVCQDNVDECLYEIDVPQRIVTTKELLKKATEAMRSLDPDEFQSPYDLQNPETSTLGALRTQFAPLPLPETVGDWECKERYSNRIKWEQTNDQSAWEPFEVEFKSHGQIVVRNQSSRDIHASLRGTECAPESVAGDYGRRYQDIFAWMWPKAMGFLISTSKHAVDAATLDMLNEHAPVDVAIGNYDHGISTAPTKTMDRENGTLLAY